MVNMKARVPTPQPIKLPPNRLSSLRRMAWLLVAISFFFSFCNQFTQKITEYPIDFRGQLMKQISMIIETSIKMQAIGKELLKISLSYLPPLVILFGDQVTRKYIAQSQDWTDHIIFAMGPMGLVAALVGTVRLCGESLVRAIVGKEWESALAAEHELTLATSEDICEVWDGTKIVRLMGTNIITELGLQEIGNKGRGKVFLKPLMDKPEAVMGKTYKKASRVTYKSQYAVAKEWGSVLGVEHELASVTPEDVCEFENGTKNVRGLGSDTLPRLLISSEQKRTLKMKSASCGQTGGNVKNINLHQQTWMPQERAPNLSLNTTRKDINRAEKLFWSCMSIILQNLVIVWVQHLSSKSNDNKNESKYVYMGEIRVTTLQCMTIGIFSINVSMFICSYASEKAMNKILFQPWSGKEINRKTPSSWRPVWIQNSGKIGDQSFDSYIIFGKARGVEKEHDALIRLEPHRKLGERYIPGYLQYLTAVACIMGIGGLFSMQVASVKGQHWSVNILQLTTTLAMVHIRSIVRRRLSSPDIVAVPLPPNFEVEWLSKRADEVWAKLEECEKMHVESARIELFRFFWEPHFHKNSSRKFVSEWLKRLDGILGDGGEIENRDLEELKESPSFTEIINNETTCNPVCEPQAPLTQPMDSGGGEIADKREKKKGPENRDLEELKERPVFAEIINKETTCNPVCKSQALLTQPMDSGDPQTSPSDIVCLWQASTLLLSTSSNHMENYPNINLRKPQEGWFNHQKILIERYSSMPISWWPLVPPVYPDMMEVNFKCV